ncbi:MAG TPA: BON domain-containing protein [Acidimicrobiales bacterium]|nr:BON domain-containing protein [Acidimicrobiales bacterium]
MRMLRRLLPVSNLGLALWAWRNRATVLDWAAFGLRAAGDVIEGKGLGDARAEARLRLALARHGTTRRAAIDVAVEDGTARIEGRVPPEVHARVQDIVAATPGISRLDDRLALLAPRRRFRLRAA